MCHGNKILSMLKTKNLYGYLGYFSGYDALLYLFQVKQVYNSIGIKIDKIDLKRPSMIKTQVVSWVVSTVYDLYDDSQATQNPRPKQKTKWKKDITQLYE